MARTVCPVWIGYLHASPLRKLLQNPGKMLAPYVKESMKVLDVGCAMGFFSLPLARMVGSKGKVVCVDVQKRMIESLQKRAERAGLSHRIETRVCDQNSLGLDDFAGEIDFALAAAVVHEVPDASDFFSEIYDTIAQHGKFLVVEPKGHVSERDFEMSISLAEQNGFKIIDRPQISRSRAALFERREMEIPTRIANFRIRSATKENIPLILSFIRELAAYEKRSHEVVATEEILQETLFGDRRVAEVILGYFDGEPVSFALFFHNFSTFLGRPGIYLEDLFVKPEMRRKGIGRVMLAYLAHLAKERRCGRLEWWVLDWNKPAISFYRSLGAAAMDEWTVHRLTGEPLDRLAKEF
jgi:ubiquinone/menaquinone biosynthesis C-methylase UbiE/predicted acetyltransferase